MKNCKCECETYFNVEPNKAQYELSDFTFENLDIRAISFSVTIIFFQSVKKLAEKEENVIFGGRLGDYKYYDMDKVVAAALDRLEEFN